MSEAGTVPCLMVMTSILSEESLERDTDRQIYRLGSSTVSFAKS